MMNINNYGQDSVATSAVNCNIFLDKPTNEFFDELANKLGVKRYSEEYNRYIWEVLLGVNYDDVFNNNMED